MGYVPGVDLDEGLRQMGKETPTPKSGDRIDIA